MKGLSSKRTALKVDVIGPENILFAGISIYIFQPNNFTGWGGEGVKLTLSDLLQGKHTYTDTVCTECSQD